MNYSSPLFKTHDRCLQSELVDQGRTSGLNKLSIICLTCTKRQTTDNAGLHTIEHCPCSLTSFSQAVNLFERRGTMSKSVILLPETHTS